MRKLVMFFRKVWSFVRNCFTRKSDKPSNTSYNKTEYPSYRDSNIHREPQGGYRDIDLRKYYNEAESPEVTYKVFHMRVTVFKWNIQEALYESGKPNDSQVKVVFAGKSFNLKEIYDACKNPSVSYNTFYTRVIARGWDIKEALYTMRFESRTGEYACA